jgi:hypothetical protein
LKNMKGIGVLAAVIGMILYKVMSYYYGDSGPKLAVVVCVSISLSGIMGLVLMKQFVAAVFMFMIGLPVITGAIGMYFDNALVLFGSIILIFIMIPIAIKIAPHLAKY